MGGRTDRGRRSSPSGAPCYQLASPVRSSEVRPRGRFREGWQCAYVRIAEAALNEYSRPEPAVQYLPNYPNWMSAVLRIAGIRLVQEK